MSRKRSTALALLALVGVLAWAPWVTEDYAVAKVTQKLGGEDSPFNYLGDEMPLRDVPKKVVRVPFGALVYFPGEAVFIVTFFGLVV